jgi:hypothetical protein
MSGAKGLSRPVGKLFSRYKLLLNPQVFGGISSLSRIASLAIKGGKWLRESENQGRGYPQKIGHHYFSTLKAANRNLGEKILFRNQIEDGRLNLSKADPKTGRTALMDAVMGDKKEEVELLIASGRIQWNQEDKTGKSIFFYLKETRKAIAKNSLAGSLIKEAIEGSRFWERILILSEFLKSYPTMNHFLKEFFGAEMEVFYRPSFDSDSYVSFIAKKKETLSGLVGSEDPYSQEKIRECTAGYSLRMWQEDIAKLISKIVVESECQAFIAKFLLTQMHSIFWLSAPSDSPEAKFYCSARDGRLTSLSLVELDQLESFHGASNQEFFKALIQENPLKKIELSWTKPYLFNVISDHSSLAHLEHIEFNFEEFVYKKNRMDSLWPRDRKFFLSEISKLIKNLPRLNRLTFLTYSQILNAGVSWGGMHLWISDFLCRVLEAQRKRTDPDLVLVVELPKLSNFNQEQLEALFEVIWAMPRNRMVNFCDIAGKDEIAFDKRIADDSLESQKRLFLESDDPVAREKFKKDLLCFEDFGSIELTNNLAKNLWFVRTALHQGKLSFLAILGGADSIPCGLLSQIKQPIHEVLVHDFSSLGRLVQNNALWIPGIKKLDLDLKKSLNISDLCNLGKFLKEIKALDVLVLNHLNIQAPRAFELLDFELIRNFMAHHSGSLRVLVFNHLMAAHAPKECRGFFEMISKMQKLEKIELSKPKFFSIEEELACLKFVEKIPSLKIFIIPLC